MSDAFAADPRSGMVAKGGLVPVFVDVDPHTYTIDPEQAPRRCRDLLQKLETYVLAESSGRPQ